MAWGAALLAVLVFFLLGGSRWETWQRGLSDRSAVAALAIFAALLSVAYISLYLRGGPRIIDATTYYLQARALAGGHVAFDVPAPSASFRGRFLLSSPDGHA